MKKAKLLFIGILFFGLIIVGCGLVYTIKTVPQVQKCSNDYYEATITPFKGYTGFSLTIRNKTDKNLELDWNRTLFIKHGQTSGIFMIEGTIFRDRNILPKAPDIIFPRASFQKAIMPNILVAFKKDWYHQRMGYGEHGLLLCVKIDDKEVMERMVIGFTRIRRW